MKKITNQITYLTFIISLFIALSSSVAAQQVLYNYQYRLDLTGATKAPKLAGMPSIEISKDARKMGVEGTLKAVMTLAKDGTVKDFKFEQSLPHGVEETFMKGYKTLKFQPAKRNGVPIDVKLYVDFIITAVYRERDRSVKKPKIIEQPEAVYPPKLLSEGRKDKVSVDVLFNKDGTVKVLRVESSMPRAFDKAAREAAEKIKFEPATHKKSKKPITMQMTVEYKFKP